MRASEHGYMFRRFFFIPGDAFFGRRAKVDFCRNGVGQNCCQVFTNTCCNYMKTRNLAIQNLGRKYVKIFEDGIAVSEKMTIFATQ